ncbi:hypothetical protein PCANC_17578 [Puccinia coronata f. sp. avenae]|uniref:Uncharacterized protein n=1 Tax=Puccinia coronata f. sp. avenae TaxID=200324 RepID=A0A2N5VMZ3_9BASI|nr:hypothetical protein PCANC_17578 [Puccinia coronata f. sp. avenae]
MVAILKSCDDLLRLYAPSSKVNAKKSVPTIIYSGTQNVTMKVMKVVNEACHRRHNLGVRASPVDSLDRGPRPQSSESRPKLGSNGLATRPAKPIQGPSHSLNIKDDSEPAPGHQSPTRVEDTSRLLPHQRLPATFFTSSTL